MSVRIQIPTPLRQHTEGKAAVEASGATVQGVLEECGRFMSEVIAPLNRVGDTEGSRRNPDGTVTTPTGFPQAYRRYVDAGWPAVGPLQGRVPNRVLGYHESSRGPRWIA